MCVSMCLCVAFLYFLALQDALGLSCMFPAPVLESIIFPRNPGSFYWIILLKTKIWALDVLIVGSCLNYKLKTSFSISHMKNYFAPLPSSTFFLAISAHTELRSTRMLGSKKLACKKYKK